ncbi:hypothetical protein QJQ45_024559 [Haematococcus lacustris]|nr:hypothetical protein QJQ45_024559 [Haematococcus lacustris]
MSMELHARSAVRDTSFWFRVPRSAPAPDQPTTSRRFLYGQPVQHGCGPVYPALALALTLALTLTLLTPTSPSLAYPGCSWVFCRQRQDSSLRRGGEQLSVVVLAEHPWSSVLRPLSQVAGPLLFSSGPQALEQVFQEVSAWPPPTSGPLLQLQVGATTLSSRLPPFTTLPCPSCTTAVDKGPLLRLTSSGSVRSVSRSNSNMDPLAPPGGAGGLPGGGLPRGAGSGQWSSGQWSSGRPGAQPSPPPPGPGAAPVALLPRRLSLTSGVGDPAVGGSPGAGAFCEADVFGALSAHLNRLWQLWEMVLLCKPLLVVAPSPTDCSAAVAALISLTAPLPYARDFRPYYTIHDPGFAALANGGLPGGGGQQGGEPELPCLLGVTNLYFVRALAHWPSVLSVGVRDAGGPWSGASARSSASGGVGLAASSALTAAVGVGGGGEGAEAARAGGPGTLRRGLTAGCPPGSPLSSCSCCAPLPCVPPPASWTAWGGSSAALAELYGRLLAAPSFNTWFELQRRRLQHLLPPAAPPSPSGSPSAASPGLAWFSTARKHLDEVELVGLFGALEAQLRTAIADAQATDAPEEAALSVTRLQSELATLFLGIGQEDLQLLCISAPHRQALLLEAAQQRPLHNNAIGVSIRPSHVVDTQQAIPPSPVSLAAGGPMPAAGSLNVSASVRKLGPIHPFSCWQELEKQFLFEQPRLHPTRLIAMVKSLVKSLPDRHSSELGPYLSPRSSQWWRLLLLHCQPQLPSFNSQDMSMLLWALASMATAPLSCLGPGPPLTPGAGRGAGQAQSTTVALLLPPGFLPQLLEAYLSASAPQLSRAAPQALANMGWALAVVEAPVASSPWAAAFWQASALQASASPPAALAQMLWAAARLGLAPPPDWPLQLADAALGCLQACQAQDLANILWALAKLRARPSPEWMTAWLAAVGRRLGGSAPFPAPELSALLVGLAHLGFQPGPASLAPLLEALRGRLHRAGPQVMCNSLWALAKLRVQPGQAWMQEVLGSLALQLEGAGPAELAMCWWALGRLGYRPPGSLVRELQTELRLQAEALRARELVMLLQGYTRLGLVLPKPGLDRLMSLLLRKLSLLWRRARCTRLRPAVLTTCSALSALALMARSSQGRHGLSQHTVVRQLLCRATRQSRIQWHRAGPGAAQQQQQGGPRGQPGGPEGAAAQTAPCRPALPPPAGLAGWRPGDIALVLSSLVALRQLPPARWCQAALTSLQASPPGSWPLKDLAMAAWALARLQRLTATPPPRPAPPPAPAGWTTPPPPSPPPTVPPAAGGPACPQAERLSVQGQLSGQQRAGLLASVEAARLQPSQDWVQAMSPALQPVLQPAV